MNKITKPTIKTISNKTIIDMGDREIIINELLPVTKMKGYIAAEKLKEARGSSDDLSFWPTFPQIIDTGSKIYSSLDSIFDDVLYCFDVYCKKNGKEA